MRSLLPEPQPTHRRALWRLGLALLATLVITGLVAAFSAGSQDRVVVVVPLRSRSVTISPATTSRFLEALRDSSVRFLHGLGTFRRHPTPVERRALASRGVSVLSPLRGRTYRVRVARDFGTDDSTVRALLAGLVLLEPRDRVAPSLWRQDSAARLYRLAILFQPEVSESAAKVVLGNRLRAVRSSDRLWRVETGPPGLMALAQSDLVQWIDSVNALQADNDRTRAAVGVDAVQDFIPLIGQVDGLGGANIQVGVFEIEGFDQQHPDFTDVMTGYSPVNRVIVQHAARSWHGTLVAGILAGNGRWSSQKDSWNVLNGVKPWQWRGMAPRAELIEAIPPDDGLPDGAALRDFIVAKGLDLSNHSYGWEHPGQYGNGSIQRDQMIRGDATVAGLAIPPRLQVFPAGNMGGWSSAANPGSNPVTLGYFTLDKEIKNGLVIGSWMVANDRVPGSSSLGPTFDGRIKPDVVAPGSQIKSTGYWRPGTQMLLCTAPPAGTTSATTERRDFYGTECGTSLAAPVVTGVLAQVLEQYALTFGPLSTDAHPLPSTLRGIIIHSAGDKGTGTSWFTNADGPVTAFPGPDFVTGFGLVDAAAAVDAVRSRQIIVDTIEATCDVRSFPHEVVAQPDGTTPDLKITLAWDDWPDDPASPAGLPRLRNDLDLVLIDPDGNRHYPWQLNQTITDSDGNGLTAEQQTCDSEIVVTPRLTGPGPLPAGMPVAADRGPDHLNNVEQVVVAPGTAGTWTVQVSGFSVEHGPQRFSLIGVYAPKLQLPPMVKLCGLHPRFCMEVLVPICQRFPRLCEYPVPLPLDPREVYLSFRRGGEPVVFPVEQLCAGLKLPEGCESSPGASYEFRFGPSPVPLGIEVFSDSGTRVGRIRVGRNATRLVLRTEPQARYFMVVTPSTRRRPTRPFPLPVSARRLPR